MVGGRRMEKSLSTDYCGAVKYPHPVQILKSKTLLQGIISYSYQNSLSKLDVEFFPNAVSFSGSTSYIHHYIYALPNGCVVVVQPKLISPAHTCTAVPFRGQGRNFIFGWHGSLIWIGRMRRRRF